MNYASYSDIFVTNPGGSAAYWAQPFPGISTGLSYTRIDFGSLTNTRNTQMTITGFTATHSHDRMYKSWSAASDIATCVNRYSRNPSDIVVVVFPAMSGTFTAGQAWTYQASATKNVVCIDIYIEYNPGFEIFVLLENWEDGDVYYHPSYLKLSDQNTTHPRILGSQLDGSGNPKIGYLSAFQNGYNHMVAMWDYGYFDVIFQLYEEQGAAFADPTAYIIRYPSQRCSNIAFTETAITLTSITASVTFTGFTLFTSTTLATYGQTIDQTALFTIGTYEQATYTLATEPAICGVLPDEPDLIEVVGLSGSVLIYYLGDTALPLIYGFTGVNTYCTVVSITAQYLYWHDNSTSVFTSVPTWMNQNAAATSLSIYTIDTALVGEHKLLTEAEVTGNIITGGYYFTVEVLEPTSTPASTSTEAPISTEAPYQNILEQSQSPPRFDFEIGIIYLRETVPRIVHLPAVTEDKEVEHKITLTSKDGSHKFTSVNQNKKGDQLIFYPNLKDAGNYTLNLKLTR